MVPPVAYNGVESAEGGNIFEGISFWVSLKVPIRKILLENIKSNRGNVVPLEKNADILIADHLRSDVPAGSYSWKFIEDSVNNGVIQLKDRYLIGVDPVLARSVKTSRTKFTAEDDAILAKWVLTAGADGLAGNKIYQELGDINQRHPWQSWRNRWVNTLSTRPHRQLKEMAATAPDEVVESGQEQVRAESRTRLSNQNTERDQRRGQQDSGVRTSNANTPKPTTRAQQGTHSRPMRTSPHQASPRTPTRATPRNDKAISQHSVKDQFYSDLDDFMLANDLDFEKQQVVGGITIELWDLGNLVEAQKVPQEEVDWMKVAEELGYTWEVAQEVATELQACYENFLMEFLEAMANYMLENDSQNATYEGHAESTVGVADHMGLPSSPPGYVPASPTQNTARKRRQPDSERQPSPHVPKRRRGNARSEISNTPEDVGDPAMSNRTRISRSPSLGQSPVAHRPARDLDGSQQLPNLQSQHSSFEATPSQQLRSEQLDSSPVTPGLDKVSPKQITSVARRSDPEHITTNIPLATRDTSQRVPPNPRAANAKKRTLPASFNTSTNTDWRRNAESEEMQQPQPNSADNEARRRMKANQDQNQREINKWIQHYESFGYSHRNVVEALKRTTMTPGGLTGIVMESLQTGQGVPKNHEGIWTDRDDDSLRLVDTVDPSRANLSAQEKRQVAKAEKEWKRLNHKHGFDRIELRRRFLEVQDANPVEM